MPGNDLTALRDLIPTAATTRATARANITTILDGILSDIEPSVTPSGMDINSNLSFLSGGSYNAATNMNYAQLRDFGDSDGPNDNGSLFRVGNELYFLDGAGNPVAMTSGGALSGTPGSITGAGYGAPVEVAWDAATAEYRMKSGAGTHALADVVLDRSRFSDGTTHYATLGAQASMAATLAFSLPIAFPGSTSVMTLTSAGLMGSTRALSVDSVTTTGDATIGGNATVTGNLAVTGGYGAVSATTLTASGDVTVGNNLNHPEWIKLLPPASFQGASAALVTGGGTVSWASGEVCAPITIPDVGGEITQFGAYVQQSSSGTIIVSLVRVNQDTGTVTVLDSSSTGTSGSFVLVFDSPPALTAVQGSLDAYYLKISGGGGTKTCRGGYFYHKLD